MRDENPVRPATLSDRDAMSGPAAADDGPVESPCVSVCTMDAAAGLCTGCLRTLDEIAAWGGADAVTRRAILAAVDARRDARSGLSGDAS